MNVSRMVPGTLGTLDHYVEVAIGLTVLTSWVAIALQKESDFHPSNPNILGRVLWPVFYVYKLISTLVKRAFGPTEPQPPPNSTGCECVLEIFIAKEADGEYDRRSR